MPIEFDRNGVSVRDWDATRECVSEFGVQLQEKCPNEEGRRFRTERCITVGAKFKFKFSLFRTEQEAHIGGANGRHGSQGMLQVEHVY